MYLRGPQQSWIGKLIVFFLLLLGGLRVTGDELLLVEFVAWIGLIFVVVWGWMFWEEQLDRRARRIIANKLIACYPEMSLDDALQIVYDCVVDRKKTCYKSFIDEMWVHLRELRDLDLDNA